MQGWRANDVCSWWPRVSGSTQLHICSGSIPSKIVVCPSPRPPSPCPSRGSTNVTYFGDICNVPGSRGSNTVECGNPSCRADLTFDVSHQAPGGGAWLAGQRSQGVRAVPRQRPGAVGLVLRLPASCISLTLLAALPLRMHASPPQYNKRVLVVDKTPEVKAEEIAAAEAKKKAAAAKKVPGGYSVAAQSARAWPGTMRPLDCSRSTTILSAPAGARPPACTRHHQLAR